MSECIKQIYNIDQLDPFMVVSSFTDEDRRRITSKVIDNEKEKIKKRFPNIHHISGMFESPNVFFIKHQDLIESTTNGTQEEIQNYLYTKSKKYDVYNSFNKESYKVKFESDERIQKEFNGSYFFYYR